MEYVSQVLLTANGKKIDDFKKVTEREVEYYKQVNLMKKTGHVKMTPRYGVTVEYVVPSSGTRVDWKGIKNGTLIVADDDSSHRRTYTGVYVLKVGEIVSDGENERVQTIELGAEDRVEE